MLNNSFWEYQLDKKYCVVKYKLDYFIPLLKFESTFYFLVMSVISLILLLLQLICADPIYSCTDSGYDEYLAYYQSKCGTDCEEYKKYHTACLA